MATIRDVANLCGVSTATVSHVLNGRNDRVGAETRERVLAAIRELRYRPPAMELRQKDILSQNLAFIVEDLSDGPIRSHGYFSQIFDGVLEAAAKRAFSVTVFIERMWSESGQAVRRSYDGRCDGVVLLAPKTDSPLLQALPERGVPLVVIGTTVDIPGVSFVDVDNAAVGYEMTKYLIGLGHRRIAYIGASTTTSSAVERASGYRRAMDECGIRSESRIMFSSVQSTTEFQRYKLDHHEAPPKVELEGAEVVGGWTEEMLQALFDGKHSEPTAIVCWNDDLARLAIRALQAMGKRVPQDVSVVGVDDGPPATLEKPHLTTWRQPLTHIGRRAVDLLVDRIYDHSLPDESVRYAAELVARQSAAAPGI